MFKKQSIEKNRSLGNKLDGNEVNNFAIYQKKYSKRNIYDQFSRLTNRNPSEEICGVVIPDYVTVTYQCVIFTDYRESSRKGEDHNTLGLMIGQDIGRFIITGLR